jgi:hypothetical protein
MTSPFEEKIKSSLDASVDDLDTATKQRLEAIRREALTQPKHKSWWSSFNVTLWVPATGLALCSIMAAILWLPQLNAPDNIMPIEQTAMFELMENPEDIDVLIDPGFYLWIDELEAQHV